MIRALGGIAMISGFLVVFVYQITFDRIAENRRLALEQAIFQVIPGLDRASATRISFHLDAEGLRRLDEGSSADANLYAVYRGDRELAGVAMEAAAQGYQDVVRTLYGYSLDCECIIGITVIQSTETPGLGDRVETDPDFIANFEALDARLSADRAAVANPIETVKHGTKTEPWQIDAISGATVTSKAIGRGLRESTVTMLPMLAQHVATLRAAGHSHGAR